MNTYNIVREKEKMPHPAALAEILIDHGIRLKDAPTGNDLEKAHTLRAALREVFSAPDDETAATLLNRILAEHHALPYFHKHDGNWQLHATDLQDDPIDQYAVTAAMGLLGVITTAGMSRLHTCDGNRCEEVFVDISRNQSRRYCSPQICGNRASAAAHRARRKSTI
ncbi:CGNR zinc finger domain-containing protein [Streptomyces cyaneofuscatus]|uniref:CGNR zinc finger domain-containing protein n=1 Tax=Streptomyces cyaneofuscatus TaxID=66883 RepID=UPI003811EBEA